MSTLWFSPCGCIFIQDPIPTRPFVKFNKNIVICAKHLSQATPQQAFNQALLDNQALVTAQQQSQKLSGDP